MGGDPGTKDAEPKNAESTQASVSQCTPTSCKYNNDKYKLGCAECKRLAHYGFTSLPNYQRQLSLQGVTKNSYVANVLKYLYTYMPYL